MFGIGAGVFTAALVMEAISGLIHKHLFHGPLWPIHQTHHVRGREVGAGRFEPQLNDLFSLFFAMVAVVLIRCGVVMMKGSTAYWPHFVFGSGLGMSLYGIAYFILHDAFTHGRFFRVELRNGWLRAVRDAHRLHHQSVEKCGRSPFGFLFGPFMTNKEKHHG